MTPNGRDFSFFLLLFPSGCTHLQAIANVEGLVVIDVVEGTALSSLPHMATVLRQRPASFDSQEVAVHWARRSGESTAQTQELFNSTCNSV